MTGTTVPAPVPRPPQTPVSPAQSDTFTPAVKRSLGTLGLVARVSIAKVSGTHDFNRVEARGDGYVLVCTCGWRTSVVRTAEAVGRQWDDHRAEATS
ncbi:MAG: hypothetical protein JWO68_3140 [Actinomycetia bacterium]|nr:hypothetical protein [Actinomycetes bacterium]